MQYLELFLRGFGTNVLITILAAIVPITAGILLSLLARVNSKVSAVISAISIPFESILIPVAITICYYALIRIIHIGNARVLRTFLVVFVLALTHWLYMPARYNEHFSFLKNILYNSLGLLSSLFKWSFVSFTIGVADAFSASRNVYAITFDGFWSFWVTLLGAFCILFFVEIARWLIKTFMK